MVFVGAARGSGKNLLIGYGDFPPRSLGQIQNLLGSDWKSLPVGRSLAGGQGHVGPLFLQLLEETTTWQQDTMGLMRIQGAELPVFFHNSLLLSRLNTSINLIDKGPTNYSKAYLSLFFFCCLGIYKSVICTWIMIFFKLRYWYVTLY